ncbi:MAG: multidrug transporter [Clostridia bacterium]|nr:multidrug transporter [Clostridia bacterium]
MEISKKDWKIYREKIGEWQENYMDRLCREYVRLLQSDAAPSERFWALEERIKEDKTRPGVRIELRKGDMMFDLVRLICEEVITIDDLSDFSEDVQDGVKFIMQRFSNDNDSR